MKTPLRVVIFLVGGLLFARKVMRQTGADQANRRTQVAAIKQDGMLFAFFVDKQVIFSGYFLWLLAWS